MEDDTSKYNRLFRLRDAIDSELKLRGQEARVALVPLLRHKNIQVRLNAAIDGLAIAPVEARAVLQQIRESLQGPQCPGGHDDPGNG